MRFAVISDVHGNRPALDAVLEDIAVQGADAILCLGDHVSGPIDPVGVADRLMSLSGPIIAGNHDRWLIERSGEDLEAVDKFVVPRMNPAHRAWLEAMPPTSVFEGEVFLCHGTPRSDNTIWLDNFWYDRKTRLPDEPAVAAEAEGVDYPMLLCGHTHVARSVRLRDGRRIVNPGSVGLQLIHGSPDARYALIERRNGKWLTAIRMVDYDREEAAQLAIANGFGPWADALRTGWAEPAGLF